MAKRKLKKNNTYHSSSVASVKPKSQKEMAQTEKSATFALAAVALVVAVCVAPLAAEISSSDIHHHKYPSLKMDEAQLTVNNELSYEVQVSWMSQRCYQCLYQQLGVVPAGLGPGQPSSVNFVVSTQHEITVQINSTPIELELCKIPFHFGEHGNYSLWVKTLNASFGVNCSVVTDKDPVNSYIPILVAFLIYALLALVFAIGKKVWGLDAVRGLVLRLGSSMETERLINSELGPTRVVPPVTDNILPPPLTSSKRLRSLDTFRGISLVIMVFVNYGGGRYWFFRHESWNGLTVADLVFPWFVFIMGTSIALSINALLRAGATRCSLLRKAVWRSLQLFIIGVLVINPNYCQGALAWENLRIPGVLQRLAWSYLVVACLDLLVARGQLDVITVDAWWSPAIDFLLYWPAWLCVILLEVLWLFLTFLLPVPDCPTGYLGPGGIGDMGLYVNCTGGAAGFIDRLLLGEKHMYQNPSSRVIYATRIPYDPEGVLGSINSILMAFLGLQAGKIILHYRERPKSIMSRFLIWGLSLGVISAFLTKCSTDRGFIPVNKNLWSLSYVTTLACFAFVLLMLVYYIVDVNKWWSGAPFYYPGMNSILVYVGHEVFEDYFPFRWRMSNSQSHAEHLIQNLVATSCWVIISYLLYKKKIFWKI
ncbi:heparan-alpha-glucosaminide N-acetyltransferase isoform X1 [Oreochromis aureus]|uniref:Heparan-alpha-glucosaminide N-acetyltransferase catalytic domain-containing protein n=1 Tax=Oreochromis aureus TaxID=47969 RepID=A0A668UPZ5_OREAU|nr:heparan-alpha-glucosaminide N-acetyltransferase isoform X1 [Oreochromis aureus]